MTYQCDNTLVDHLLRYQRAVFWIGLVIASHKVELHGPVAELHTAGGIDLFDRESSAIFVVLAQVSDGARDRPDMANLGDVGTRRLGRGCSGRRGRGRR